MYCPKHTTYAIDAHIHIHVNTHCIMQPRNHCVRGCHRGAQRAFGVHYRFREFLFGVLAIAQRSWCNRSRWLARVLLCLYRSGDRSVIRPSARRDHAAPRVSTTACAVCLGLSACVHRSAQHITQIVPPRYAPGAAALLASKQPRRRCQMSLRRAQTAALGCRLLYVTRILRWGIDQSAISIWCNTIRRIAP